MIGSKEHGKERSINAKDDVQLQQEMNDFNAVVCVHTAAGTTECALSEF